MILIKPLLIETIVKYSSNLGIASWNTFLLLWVFELFKNEKANCISLFYCWNLSMQVTFVQLGNL